MKAAQKAAHLRLTSKNTEIAAVLPPVIRGQVLNSIIARSMENGLFLRECSYVFSSAEMQEITEKLQNIVKIPQATGTGSTKIDRSVRKAIAQDIKENDDIVQQSNDTRDEEGAEFFGFD